jgi:hypothetical protein
MMEAHCVVGEFGPRQESDSVLSRPCATYRTPQIQYLGDLRELTLGGSPGSTDSEGNPLLTRPLENESPGMPPGIQMP